MYDVDLTYYYNGDPADYFTNNNIIGLKMFTVVGWFDYRPL